MLFPASHRGKTDVTLLGCDFLAFSAHKIMGPTGVGVLYGKKEYLEQVEPARFGGGMVDLVNASETTFGKLPFRLEAGTPNYPGIIAFGAALDYLNQIGQNDIANREQELTDHLEAKLSAIPHVTVLGGTVPKKSVVSLIADGVHPYDLSSFLDKFGVATRSGSHCAQPLVRTFGRDTVLRFSTAFYNTMEEIDAAAAYTQQCIGMLRR
ncbi:MAG: aminotransferase class V-fold PLP-dependent enzyme [Clostridiales bacterium]|nr:aminotransferase class V-fold PLP-dependent enzyme [Clostridiales bacterium]